MCIGILALQGNFAMHEKILNSIDVRTKLVKYSRDLKKCDGLIIPGGESTTISKLIDINNLRTELFDFSKSKSIFGTCAGMILLSSQPKSNNLKPLQIMNFTVLRNAWGKQIYSFSDKIKINFLKSKYLATFIRAPKIDKISKSINVLSKYNNEIVLISDGKHLASSFHPEFNDDSRIHKYFIEMIKKNEK